jgi:chemotaxis protein histidine kinase CheA
MDETLFDSLFEEFSLEAYEQLARIEGHLLDLATASPEQQHERLVEVKRDLHTIKGNSGMMGLADLQSEAHRLEDLVGLADPGARVHDLLRGVDGLRRGLKDGRISATVNGPEAKISAFVSRSRPSTLCSIASPSW